MKIKPRFEMYNTDLHLRFSPGVTADVPDELGAEYIGAGFAEAVEEKARAEPTQEPFGNTEKLTEAEEPKKARTRKK